MVEKDGENTKIRLNLAQNAIDSINRAIELIAWQEEPDEAKRLKQAVLSVAHGVELLLKERLRLVHPSLIWENVDKYPSTSARTVGVEIAVTRLKNIGGLTFSDADILLIRSLRDTRNAIEHYSWSTTSKEAVRPLDLRSHFPWSTYSMSFLVITLVKMIRCLNCSRLIPSFPNRTANGENNLTR